MIRGSIFLVLPALFRRSPEGNILVEKQAANGLECWADNFQYVVIAAPVYESEDTSSSVTTVEYVDLSSLYCRFRLEFISLPQVYRTIGFLRFYRSTQQLLANKIKTSEYLSFAIGGLVGDWASVAALEAIRQKRPFSIWTDRVEHQVVRNFHHDHQGFKKFYYFLKVHLWVSPLMQQLERHVIRNCQLGLFHGFDCLNAYSPYCSNPHLVHDVHLKPSDCISQDQLTQKLDRLRRKDKLKILYVGRATSMKGPFDWIEVMAKLRCRDIAFEATWVGDGPLLSDMRERVAQLHLEHLVHMPGFIGDRSHLLQMMRNSDLFVFCHKTPESPRCLIESLMSASPILGYGSPYAEDLVGNLANRLLVPCNQVTTLVDYIAHFDRQRDQLSEVVQSCYHLGTQYSDQAVFAHRSHLIKQYLGPQPLADDRKLPQSLLKSSWSAINVADLNG